jgi:hypothetical protein
VALILCRGSGSLDAWRVWLALEHEVIPSERKVLPCFPETWPAHRK